MTVVSAADDVFTSLRHASSKVGIFLIVAITLIMNRHTPPVDASLVVTPFVDAPLVARENPIWRSIRDEALQSADADKYMAPLIDELVLRRSNLVDALVGVLAYRLADSLWSREALENVMAACVAQDEAIFAHLDADINAVLDRDPACSRYIEPLLFFKGFHALQAHRIAHHLFENGRRDLAYFLQSRMSSVFQMDIHPHTQIGGGIFFDHGTGIVVGQTAVIEDDVSIMQNVTLGGTGKESGDRHPKVRKGVLVGAGAKVLGNIELGHCSRVAASSVVLDPVPSGATVAGIPAKIVAMADPDSGDCMPSLKMDHHMPHERLVDEGSGI